MQYVVGYMVGRHQTRDDISISWELVGVYNNKNQAELLCNTIDHFVIPVKENTKLPDIDYWEDCYFPMVPEGIYDEDDLVLFEDELDLEPDYPVERTLRIVESNDNETGRDI